MLPIFKNVGEKYPAKIYFPFSLLSKVFKKIISNRIVENTLINNRVFCHTGHNSDQT